MRNRAGKFVKQQGGAEGYASFIPAPLPPEPPLNMDGELARLHEAAAYSLGRLRGASERLDPARLLYMYIRKEAVLSSQIEGTQSTLSNLLEYESAEIPGTPIGDVQEVSQYVKALLFAIDELRHGQLPLSLRLLRNVHEVLLSGGRGQNQTPGEFRRSQNWLGGSRPGNAVYVPPPPDRLLASLDNFEKFLHDEYGFTPTLIKTGLAHAQFETIHPFLDGNGRLGRMLISLIFVAEGLLEQPFFYISLYFKNNRSDYYDALQRIRTNGDWEGWIRFFLVAVESVSTEATQTADAMVKLFSEDRKRIDSLGRASQSALKVFELLKEKVIIGPTAAAKNANLTWPTALAALERLEQLGIVEEGTGRKRDRLYVYREQLRLLEG